MNKIFSGVAAVAIIALASSSFAQQDEWTQFRGPNGASFHKDANVPMTFSDSENIAWKIDLPGKGASSPIVVGENVIVTCSAGAKQDKLFVCCFNANDGSKKWQRQYWATGSTYCHPLSANAAPSPVSDGKFIYAFFSSNDLACLDLQGNLIWYRGLSYDYPTARNDAGMSSSPVVANGVLVVQVENQGESFVAGIDTQNGKTIWRKERERDASWSSPLVIPASDTRPATVLLQSRTGVSTVDLATGESVWSATGRCNVIPSSAMVGDQVYVPIDGTTAYDVDPSGQLKKSWNSPRLRPSTSSIVVAGDLIYSLERGGIAACFDRKTGKSRWKTRFMKSGSGQFWATPVLAGEHLYFFSQDGKSWVVKASQDKGEVVHEFDFKDVILGSPAISGNALYVRGDKHLWKIANTN